MSSCRIGVFKEQRRLALPCLTTYNILNISNHTTYYALLYWGNWEGTFICTLNEQKNVRHIIFCLNYPAKCVSGLCCDVCCLLGCVQTMFTPSSFIYPRMFLYSWTTGTRSVMFLPPSLTQPSLISSLLLLNLIILLPCYTTCHYIFLSLQNCN